MMAQQRTPQALCACLTSTWVPIICLRSMGPTIDPPSYARAPLGPCHVLMHSCAPQNSLRMEEGGPYHTLCALTNPPAYGGGRSQLYAHTLHKSSCKRWRAVPIKRFAHSTTPPAYVGGLRGVMQLLPPHAWPALVHLVFERPWCIFSAGAPVSGRALFHVQGLLSFRGGRVRAIGAERALCMGPARPAGARSNQHAACVYVCWIVAARVGAASTKAAHFRDMAALHPLQEQQQMDGLCRAAGKEALLGCRSLLVSAG